MTAACGGGPSGELPGTSPIISLTAVPVELFVAGLGAPPPVAAAIGAIVAGAADIVTANFCSGDPPADPNLQPSDMQAILDTGQYTAFTAASQKVVQWFLHNYWYKVCGCTGAPAPTAPTPTLPQSPGTNNNLPTGNANPPCWTSQMATTIPYLGTGANSWVDVTSQLIPQTTGVAVTQPPAAGGSSTAQNIPTGVTQVEMLGQSSYANLAGEPIFIVVCCYDSTGTLIVPSGQIGDTAAQRINNHPTYGLLGSFTLPANAVSIQAFLTQHTSQPNQDVSAGINFLCGSGQTVVQPCCPPDPTVQMYLQMILQLLQNIQGLPPPLTAYKHSTVHAGLAGSGLVAIGANVLALLVNVTSLPQGIGEDIGSPNRYFDVGWITPEIVGTPYAATRINYLQQQLLLPALTDSFNWTLTSGVVASVTELVAGP